MFYLAKVRGWVLPSDGARLEYIREAVAQGAEYYVDPYRFEYGQDFNLWIKENAEKVVDLGKLGRIFCLRVQGMPEAMEFEPVERQVKLNE